MHFLYFRIILLVMSGYSEEYIKEKLIKVLSRGMDYMYDCKPPADGMDILP